MFAWSGSSTIRRIGSSGRQLGGLNSWSSGRRIVKPAISAELEDVERLHLGLQADLPHQLRPARDVGLREIAVELVAVLPDRDEPATPLPELERRRDHSSRPRSPSLPHEPRELLGLVAAHLRLERDPRHGAHVEIIFFSIPTPAATARSYSS